MARLVLCKTEFSDFGHSLLMNRDIKVAFYSLLHKLKEKCYKSHVKKNACNIARLTRIAVESSIAVLQSLML